jgi:hypothetical protein
MLMDTHHLHFTGRHLYVGASRVTEGQYLHIATRYITRWINDQILQRVDHEDVEEPDVEGEADDEGDLDDAARARLADARRRGVTYGDDTEDEEP